MVKKLFFTKMHGAGNDYVYVYTPLCIVDNPEELAVQVSRPHFGIGSDGLILIGESPKADFRMRMFNNDGSEGRMCGNGIRCVAKYVYDHHYTDKTTITIETLSGIKEVKVNLGKDGKVETACVDMGVALLACSEQCTAPVAPGETFAVCDLQGTFVSMGNPHFVIFGEDCEHLPIEQIGPQIETSPLFPERCNIEFATLQADGTIRMRVWERGSGITLACGTGACATAVAAHLRGLRPRHSKVQMDGGTLSIEYLTDGHVMMTGPATTVFEGEMNL